MTGVSECSQQRGNLKDNGYTCNPPSLFMIKQNSTLTSSSS
ncbi:hypothetical protein [Photorhabdus sp. RW14-46]|nr:hypothetical protein [Photorhabdus sp. RW14-46]